MVLTICCCISHPEMEWLRTTNIYYLRVTAEFVVRILVAPHLGGSVSGSYVRLQSCCWLGLQSLEGLTVAHRSKMADSQGCWKKHQFLAGWQEMPVLHHVDLSIELLECPHEPFKRACQKPQCLLGSSFRSHIALSPQYLSYTS